MCSIVCNCIVILLSNPSFFWQIIKYKRPLIVGSSTNKHLHQGALIRYITKQHETLDTSNLHSCFIFNHPEISGFLNNDDWWTIFITLNKGVVCMTHHVSSRSITKVSIDMLKSIPRIWFMATYYSSSDCVEEKFLEQNNLCVKNDSLRKLVNETTI